MEAQGLPGCQGQAAARSRQSVSRGPGDTGPQGHSLGTSHVCRTRAAEPQLDLLLVEAVRSAQGLGASASFLLQI